MMQSLHECVCNFFFFNDTATTEIYTLSLHDALPISAILRGARKPVLLIANKIDNPDRDAEAFEFHRLGLGDRKSTRLNSSHANISYAVFCLKKKKSQHTTYTN